MKPYPYWNDEWDPEEPVAECHYCGRLLDPRFDWYCVRCIRPACDSCSEACQEKGCAEITCSLCIEPHWFETHLVNGHMESTWETSKT